MKNTFSYTQMTIFKSKLFPSSIQSFQKIIFKTQLLYTQILMKIFLVLKGQECLCSQPLNISEKGTWMIMMMNWMMEEISVQYLLELWLFAVYAPSVAFWQKNKNIIIDHLELLNRKILLKVSRKSLYIPMVKLIWNNSKKVYVLCVWWINAPIICLAIIFSI